MSKMVNKVIDILLKCAKFCVVQIILSCFKFHQVMVDTFIKELQILLLTPMLATATEKWKSLNVKNSFKMAPTLYQKSLKKCFCEKDQNVV